MRKKILHIFPSFNVGGTEMKTSIIINGTASIFEHTVFVIDESCKAEKLLDKEAGVIFENIDHRLPQKIIPKILELRKIIKDHSPDLVVTYGWGATDAVIANSIFPVAPLFHIEEGFLDESPDDQIFRRKLIRTLFFRTAKFLCIPSEYLKGVAKKTWKMKDSQIRFIANGIDTELFNVKVDNKDNKCVTLSIIASLHPVKNHSRMFRVFAEVAKMENVKLIVAGEGVDKEKLVNYAKELGIQDKVEMAGFVSDPHKILEKTDIFCLSSNSEQMPMTILEAMAASLPIVATDVGDVKSMISEENREFIVPKDNESLFAEKLLQMVKDKQLREKIGKINRKLCEEKYTREQMIENMKSLYNEAMERS